MKDERRPARNAAATSSAPDEGSSGRGRGAAWADVDHTLEVRSRVVVALDFIEEGDARTAELCLLQLLDDLDAAETIVGLAA